MARLDAANWQTADGTKSAPVSLFSVLGFKRPKSNASLAEISGREIASWSNTGTAPDGSGSPTPQGSGNSANAQAVFKALRSVGASINQAIGIMANGVAESGLNPEARVKDSNGYYSNGIWQFNELSYPDSSALVTGNPAKDMLAQIAYLIQVGGLRYANGTTAEQVAGNFAANWERCASCNPGGTSYQQRVANVASVMSTLGMNVTGSGKGAPTGTTGSPVKPFG